MSNGAERYRTIAAAITPSGTTYLRSADISLSVLPAPIARDRLPSAHSIARRASAWTGRSARSPAGPAAPVRLIERLIEIERAE